jgi:hypothetical protein
MTAVCNKYIEMLPDGDLKNLLTVFVSGTPDQLDMAIVKMSPVVTK